MEKELLSWHEDEYNGVSIDVSNGGLTDREVEVLEKK